MVSNAERKEGTYRVFVSIETYNRFMDLPHYISKNMLLWEMFDVPMDKRVKLIVCDFERKHKPHQVADTKKITERVDAIIYAANMLQKTIDE